MPVDWAEFHRAGSQSARPLQSPGGSRFQKTELECRGHADHRQEPMREVKSLEQRIGYLEFQKRFLDEGKNQLIGRPNSKRGHADFNATRVRIEFIGFQRDGWVRR